jgi:tetratricopeptide (TPR) repeat protein
MTRSRLPSLALAGLSFAGLSFPADRAGAQATAAAQTAAPSPAASRDRWADSARRAIEAATVRGDAAALTGVRTMLGRALVLAPNDGLLLHYQGYAAYREAVAHLARGDKDGARALLDQADALLARSAERLPLAETAALQSSVIGMQIGTGNPASGMWLGPKAGSAMDRALELGPRNPRVWLLRGMSAYNTPGMWGGGTEKAREYLTQAVALFASDRPAAGLPAWGEAEAHAWLGRTHQKAGDVAGARAEYARALALQPDFAWVSRVLLPSLDRPAAGGGTR